jgi:hypothetical protein
MGITHGESGYGYWGCRCETCRTAHNDAARRARSRPKERSIQVVPLEGVEP